uniref:Uncharacterized protein n=1 Tax=Fagus sylvatica TaxID=28930 RepID=A0A2N9GWJ0_FAGSY
MLVGLAEVHGWLATSASSPSFVDKLVTSSWQRDLQRPWMLNFSKLLLLESHNTRIAWHLLPWTIQFNFPVVIGCSDGIKAPSLLSFQASTIAVALAIY